MKSALVWVYGTLKEGFYNHHLLKGASSPVPFEAPHLRLWSGPFYPCVTLDVGSPYTVKGELFLIEEDTLRRLDGMEVGAGYVASSMPTSEGEARFWFMKSAPTGWDEIPSGVWTQGLH